MTPDLAPFDFNGPWRDELLQQQRIAFLAAELNGRIREWKERAEKAV